MKNSRIVFATMSAGITALSIFWTSDSSAFIRRVSAASCSLSDYVLGRAGSLARNTSTTTGIGASCGIPDDDNLSASVLFWPTITNVTATVHDSSTTGQVSVQTCNSRMDALGGFCGATIGTGIAAQPVQTNLSVDPSGWQMTGVFLGGYPFLQVNLGKLHNTLSGTITGILGITISG
jgi:hypothetical protein